MKIVVACLALVTSVACRAVKPMAVPAPLPPAFATSMTYMSNSSLGMGCLPRAGDSTLFRVTLIVDSTRPGQRGAFAVIVNPRAPARPGYINQVVSAEIQQAGSTRVTGTSCGHDAGVVFRGSAQALNEARLSVDPRRSVEVEVYSDRGALIAPAVSVDEPTEGRRIAWVVPPPNEEL